MSNLLEQASLVMIPSGYKEDVVYSEIPLDGSGDLQLTRASNGTRVNSQGLVEVCPWNLVQYSEDMNSQPLNIDVTVNTTATTSPIGTNNGNKVSETATTNAHVVRTEKATPNGYDIVSIYAKAAERTFIQIQSWADPSSYVNFNLSTGVVSAYSVATIYGIESVGNGWYRCYANVQASGSGVVGVGIITSGTAGWAQSYLGDTSKGVYMWGLQVNIGSTAKPYFPTTDRLNVPRLTYQNGGGGCPSLLLEKQSTNLVTYSEQFDNVLWIKNSTNSTANTATSPDGTQNADTITSIAVSPNIVSPLATFASITNVSIFVKYVSQRWVQLMSGGAVNDYANFDIQNGVIGSVGSTSSNAQIENFGNGWYRISVNFSGYSGPTNLYFGFVASGTAGWNTFDPNFNKSIYAWGCQIEASSYPTSYIPTTSSSATRVADACYKTGISSLIGQTEGVLFADFVYLGETQSEVIDISDGTENNRVMIYISSVGQFIVFVTTSGTTDGFISTSYSLTAGSRYKVAVAYKSNDIAFYVNGSSLGTDNSATIPATSKLTISNGGAGNYLLASQFNQAVLFKTRLTNAELASITSL